MAIALYFAQLAATWFMTGLIWFVQVVHYPLFAQVGEPGYRRYQSSHMERTSWVVVPVMAVELVTAGSAIWLPAPYASSGSVWVGLALLGSIWTCTFMLHVPAHARLAEGFDLPTQRHLVAGNWIRTLAWTIRALLLLVPLVQHPSV